MAPFQINRHRLRNIDHLLKLTDPYSDVPFCTFYKTVLKPIHFTGPLGGKEKAAHGKKTDTVNRIFYLHKYIIH